MRRTLSALATAGALVACSREAAAQKLMLGGSAGLASGVEGGDAGSGTQFRRARTRLEFTVDGRNDEDKRIGLEARVFAEIEPHASLGGGLRLIYWLSPSFVAGAGALVDIFPHSLVGADFALQVRLPIPGQTLRLLIEPSFAVVPLGTDLPDDRPILWGLLKVGIHADL